MEQSAEFDRIMHEITSGLTGDFKNDVTYINEKCDAYKNHEMAKEIQRACGRLIYEISPDEAKADIARLVNNDASGTNSVLDEAKFCIYNKDYGKALSILEPLVRKYEEAPLFQDDQVSEYRIFDEPFEETLYRFLYRPQKTIRRPTIPFSEIYHLYGGLLIDLKRVLEARTMLQKALKWNPVSFRITSEYIETFKMTGDMDSFFGLSVGAFKIAFHPADVARCHRNLGYYFVEKGKYPEAMSCYMQSLFFDNESRQAQSEMFFIYQKTGGKVQRPSTEEGQRYAEKYGFPFGMDSDILRLSCSIGKRLFQTSEASAKYYLGIAYALTGDEKLKEMIDLVEPTQNQSTKESTTSDQLEDRDGMRSFLSNSQAIIQNGIQTNGDGKTEYRRGLDLKTEGLEKAALVQFYISIGKRCDVVGPYTKAAAILRKYEMYEEELSVINAGIQNVILQNEKEYLAARKAKVLRLIKKESKASQ